MPVLASGEDHSGSTAITSFVTPTHIILGNTGDSRAVLCRGGKAHFGTIDHKPTDARETTRVQAAGGFIEMGRVNANLAVSRALGDYQYKDRADLPQEAQKITAAADMTVIERAPEDEFLLLCCDGIWDVMSNEEAVDFVTAQLKVIASILSLPSQYSDHFTPPPPKNNNTHTHTHVRARTYHRHTQVRARKATTEIMPAFGINPPPPDALERAVHVRAPSPPQTSRAGSRWMKSASG